VAPDEIASKGGRAPIKSWLPIEEIEPGAMNQLLAAASHPAIGPHLAVMPDCHQGMGVTIGSVLPTINEIIPNAVGVDIGCGMCAIDTGVQLDRSRMDRRFWRSWSGQIHSNVPSGFSKRTGGHALGELDRPLRARTLQPLLRDKAPSQLGTLGGGNHFIEAQVDERGSIWLMLHSGSRHTGLRIAKHYDELARGLAIRRRSNLPPDLAGLPLDDQSGQDYLHDMQWATEFALANRQAMLGEMLKAFERELSTIHARLDHPNEVINIHHNFAAIERHNDQELVVHRKGATRAQAGELGIIPGSMGAPSYIVRGLGNGESFSSCSHGAGRTMSRSQAKKEISESAFAASLVDTHSKASASLLDEAPGAYKDVTVVVERQRDLVDILHTLRPLITVKGDSRDRDD
jgi:tRNA-splicing ligase RtcB